MGLYQTENNFDAILKENVAVAVRTINIFDKFQKVISKVTKMGK